MYHLLRDKGAGTTLSESTQGPFETLMDAVHGLIVEVSPFTRIEDAVYKDGRYEVRSNLMPYELVMRIWLEELP